MEDRLRLEKEKGSRNGRQECDRLNRNQTLRFVLQRGSSKMVLSLLAVGGALSITLSCVAAVGALSTAVRSMFVSSLLCLSPSMSPEPRLQTALISS